MKRIIAILLCCILLLASLTACQGEIGAGEQTSDESSTAESTEAVKVIKVKRGIKKYEQLKKSDIELVEINADFYTDALITDFNEAVAYYAKRDLYVGDYLYKNQISKSQIIEGAIESLRQEIIASKESFVVVSDFVKPNSGEDVQGALQSLINENPGRTLYFNDGEYLISSSLVTKSEGPKSTTFFFSDNAVLKAAPNWIGGTNHSALICLGTLKADGTHVNDSTSNGSYFGVFGGILDGSNKAQGISIDSSRESVIYGTCIKNPTTGIVIKHGANGGPSDADIENVDIIGCGLEDSKGIAIYGTDNTITNVKIYDMENGVYAIAPGNAFRSVDVYFSEGYANYRDTIGFYQSQYVDFFYDCYVQNAATAYKFSDGNGYILDSVGAGWTYAAEKQTVFFFTNEFNSYISNCRVDFHEGTATRELINLSGTPGKGRIDAPIFDTTLENTKKYEKLLTSRGVIDLSKIENS